MHQTVVQGSSEHGGSVAAGLAGAAIVLFAVLIVLVAVLIRHYRSECHQLRRRNNQLSIENDRWHEDFAAQAGELTALRRTLAAYQLRPPALPVQDQQFRSHAEAS